MRNQSENITLHPENTVEQMMLNCQLQQIASAATRLTRLEEKNKQGRKQVEKAITGMILMLDEK